MPARVLIVDDERNIHRMLAALLDDAGYEVRAVENGHEALETCESFEPQVVLLDLVMDPGPGGIEVLERLGAEYGDAVVIMMSGKATLDDAVRATRRGAFQFLEKPLAPETVVATVAAAADLARTRAENRALRAQLPASDAIVGTSDAIEQVRRLIARVAPTASRVLILGESGTGKELVARAIHAGGPRADRPFVAVNCAAVPRELIESEMFGHERGAFTGAHARRHGKFELADRGTLFLDEVGDLEQAAQAKLLRALETGRIERVGSDRDRAVDVRVIAATNKDIERELERNAFRSDLFYRLNVFPIHIPPLRGRPEDIPQIATHLAHRIAGQTARPPRAFSPKALVRLQKHAWPGNVRELANVVERLIILGGDATIADDEVDAALGHAPHREPDAPGETDLAGAIEQYERDLIRQALAAAGGNVAEAARALATDRANLYRRMRRLGIDR